MCFITGLSNKAIPIAARVLFVTPGGSSDDRRPGSEVGTPRCEKIRFFLTRTGMFFCSFFSSIGQSVALVERAALARVPCVHKQNGP